VRAHDWNDPETLRRLTQIQETKSEAINPDNVMDRVVKLARKELGADGTGVWLFTGNEIFFGAGAGQASNDERLRLTLLSTLLISWCLSEGSLTQVGKPVASNGGIKSWLVEPLFQGRNVAGVLAAFSSRLDAFAELDSAKIHSFAEVLEEALTKASAVGSVQSPALEPALALQLIEQMIPGLQHMVGSEPWTASTCEFQQTDSDYDAFPPMLNAESVEKTNAFDKAMGIAEQVDTTWLETAPGPPRPPHVSAIKAYQQANAGTADQTIPEREAVECSNPNTEDRPIPGRAVALVRNYASRALGGVRAVDAWLVNLGGFQSLAGLRAVFRTTTVLLVVMTIGFLVLRTDRHIRTQAAESSSGTRALEKSGQVADENPTYREIPQDDDAARVAIPQSQATEHTRTTPPMQVSHMQVTDNNAKNVLRSLSRYEFVGVRRRALYGDDSAAFLLGMAYETGHGVRQDCKAAAQWVSNAAAEGNAVAQYNLGLRYRDGDGVTMNTEAATMWLRKAAGHQIPGARMALVAVSSR
jgi:Sel1 repeat/GAF domain